MAVAFDLLSAEYGWTRPEILDLDLGQIRQAVAAIQRRQFLDDLARRRIETAKLRTLCAYIASTMQLAEGADNFMLTESARLTLGPGTELADNPGPPTPGPHGPATSPNTGPVGVPAAAAIPVNQLADAPPSVRAGQPAAVPAGLRELPFERLGSMLSAGPA